MTEQTSGNDTEMWDWPDTRHTPCTSDTIITARVHITDHQTSRGFIVFLYSSACPLCYCSKCIKELKMRFEKSKSSSKVRRKSGQRNGRYMLKTRSSQIRSKLRKPRVLKKKENRLFKELGKRRRGRWNNKKRRDKKCEAGTRRYNFCSRFIKLPT